MVIKLFISFSSTFMFFDDDGEQRAQPTRRSRPTFAAHAPLGRRRLPGRGSRGVSAPGGRTAWPLPLPAAPRPIPFLSVVRMKRTPGKALAADQKDSRRSRRLNTGSSAPLVGLVREIRPQPAPLLPAS